jgi:hypothetical protein
MGKPIRRHQMNHDITVLRELAKQLAEISALPVQEEKRSLWRRLNGLKETRPMIMIDQVCWNEMNVNDELTLRCKDWECRDMEREFRKMLYQYNHFPVDSVVEPFIRVPKAINGMWLGISSEETVLDTDVTNDVKAHAYKNQIQTWDDVEKIRMPVITHDEAETGRRVALAQEICDGLLEVRPDGYNPYLSVWDPISVFMGMENALYALADNPDMMKALAERIVAAQMSGLDQLERQKLLCGPQSLIHCTGAWTDELEPGDTAKSLWMFGLAQMFSSVSPAMFQEFEVEVNMPIFERFGLVYYGCCDPLDFKMKEVRGIPNARKISMSPWAGKTRGAEAIGKDYVFSYKPNPAYLVTTVLDEDLIRRDLRETMEICKKYSCQLEMILKDISTVKYQPERLWRWAEIAMEEVNG